MITKSLRNDKCVVDNFGIIRKKRRVEENTSINEISGRNTSRKIFTLNIVLRKFFLNI